MPQHSAARCASRPATWDVLRFASMPAATWQPTAINISQSCPATLVRLYLSSHHVVYLTHRSCFIFSERYIVNATLLRSHSRLSVCVSVTRVSREYFFLQNLFTPPHRPLARNPFISGGGLLYRRGIKKWRFSTIISLYLQNNIK